MAKFNPKFHQSQKRGRSTFEDTIDEQLAKSGVDYAYEPYKIPWVDTVASGECLSCGHRKVGQRRNYTPDFEVKASTTFLIEVKGYLDSSDRKKLVLVKKQHPDLDIRLVFQRNNPIAGLKEKPRYTEWAEKQGFKWALKSVPEEWLR